MGIKEFGQLILYVIYRAEELGGYTTTIRLVKFLYLIDLEHQRRRNRILTGLEWVYHLHGPYAFEIPEVGAGLGFDLTREEFINASGHSGSLLRARQPQEFPSTLNYSANVLVNGLLDVWANVETDLLLEYVYSTEPMRQAQPGDKLDLSVVPPGTRYYEPYVHIPDPVARQLRESLRSYAEEDVERYVRPDTFFDETLVEGLDALDDTENRLLELAGTQLKIDTESLRKSLPREE
jgi:hypothetical protein